ncbi:hypothetical protein LCGC14_2251530 [marine sediment metagenome]|uniref:LamG-like jellyroll fold domain-containing protein n=1 Tax=marine sediment metagenome TaxID=412755 RepID=A0A0F9D298_9ZZZZ
MRLKPRIFRKPQLTHPLARGLVGYWLFNEGSGNKVNDLSGNGNTGTFVNSPTWVPGEFGPAINFSGAADEYVNVLDSPELDGHTAMTWVFSHVSDDLSSANLGPLSKYEAINGERSWAIRQSGGVTEYNLVISNDGNAFEAQETANLNLVVGIRNQLAFTFDDGTGKAYKDGILTDTLTFSTHTSIFAGSKDVKIGTYRATEFNGLIDYVIIYNRALSASEIAQLYIDPFTLFDRSHLPLWQSGAAPPSPGQVIFITKAEREAAIKTAIPMMWACQGMNNRRDFMKHTSLAMFGL